YGMRVTIGAFPPDSTLYEMQMALMHINLAFGLNPDAHLAMSHPTPVCLAPSGTELRDPVEVFKSEPFQRAQDRLKRVFLAFRSSIQSTPE
ncbi:MAG: hypothetical protein KDA89_18720, partial [Planctomycetaceae bacterium]|nr:hypothetical protein [Planctomycetaceae bacterium]